MKVKKEKCVKGFKKTNKGNKVLTIVVMMSVFRKRKKHYALMLRSRPLVEAGIFLFVLHL